MVPTNMMEIAEALQIASKAWCSKKNRNKILDPELALEFARILREEVNNRLAEARTETWRDRPPLL